MPFDPNSPFDPADPTQRWRLRNLLQTPVQPNAPPYVASGNTAKSDGIDDRSVLQDDGFPNDWFVPEADGFPNDWFVPEADGFPNDWIYPDNQNAPTPAAAPTTAPPAPSPPPNPANPATSTRPAARFDPYEAFWSQMPASRAGAMAWHPPIFLSADSFSPQDTPSWARGSPPPTFSNPLAQFLPATYARPNLPPDFGTGGILGGIAKLAAEQAKANDPWEVGKGGILGGIPKLRAASGSAGPWPMSDGLFGSLANLQPAASNAQAGEPFSPNSQPFLPPDPIRYQGSPSYAFLRNDRLNVAGLTAPAADQLPSEVDAFPDAAQENGGPKVLLVGGGEDEKEHNKVDPAVFIGLTDVGPTTSPTAPPTLPPTIPFFARPSLPPTTDPPPAARASLPPPSQPPPGASAPPSAGQAGIGPRLPGARAGTVPASTPAPQSASTTRDGLLRHLDEALMLLDRNGLTVAQKASLKNNPWLESMHRGERIDTFVKELVANDKSLRHLTITPRFKFGPDFHDPVNNRWYDVTTIGQWKSHEGRYTLGFGQGIPLLYGGDK
jgi:hypothetical protein